MTTVSTINPAFRPGAQDPFFGHGDDLDFDVPRSPTVVEAAESRLEDLIDSGAVSDPSVDIPHSSPSPGLELSSPSTVF